MTCARALEQMLASDPGELTGTVDSAMASHLRMCSRCRAVAARLDLDTGVLASALARHRLPAAARVRRRAGWYHAGALVTVAAGVMAVVLLRTPRARQSSPIPTPGALIVDAPLAPARDLAPVSSSTRRDRAHAPLRSYPRATALTAAPLRPVAIQPRQRSSALSPAVVVTPPAGQRAVILRSAQSGITVVWLY